MTIALIDYGSGNLRSAARALERAAQDIGLPHDSVIVTSDAEVVRRAERIVLPGVGAFADCKRGLDAVPGMVGALNDAVLEKRVPFLGICVGMQLMASFGHEYGTHKGLGWIAGDVRRLVPSDPTLKIPHMGWNDLLFDEGVHPILAGVVPGTPVYFVHSYAMTTTAPEHTLARADYGGPVAAVVGRDNLVGTQFHPEKSQTVGLHIVANFLRWTP